MGAAINTWRKHLEEFARLRRAVAGFSGGLVRSINKWRDFLAESQRMRAMLFRAVNTALTKAFRQWRAGPKLLGSSITKKARARLANDPRAIAFDTWHAGLATYWLMRRSLLHLTKRGLSKGLRAWEAHHETMLLMAMAGSRMVSTLATRGMNTWCAWCDQRLEMERKISGVLHSLRSPLRKVLNTWAVLLDGPGLRERALRRLGNSRLNKGWNSLVELCALLERKRRALAHFMGQEYVKAWNGWGDFLASAMLKRRALASFVHGSSARCMRAWRGLVLERLERLERMKVVARSLSSKRRAALNSWLALCEESIVGFREAATEGGDLVGELAKLVSEDE